MPSVEGNLSFCSRINFTSIQKESASKFGTTQTIYRYVNLKTDKRNYENHTIINHFRH